MPGFRPRRRARGAAPPDGSPGEDRNFRDFPNLPSDGRDSTGVAPGRRGSRTSSLTDADIAASRPKATAVEYGISMLAARSWPERKLREKIRSRYSEEDTEAGLARLRELRLVDDVAWAERYARDRFERLGKGRHRIRMELIGKGIDAPTADAALDRVVGGDDERAKAAATLEQLKARLVRGPAGQKPARHAGQGSDPGADADNDPDATPGDTLDDAPEDAPSIDPRESRAEQERLKNRLFRRMLARGFPASVVRDLLEIS